MEKENHKKIQALEKELEIIDEAKYYAKRWIEESAVKYRKSIMNKLKEMRNKK